jgi:hypothetical protein
MELWDLAKKSLDAIWTDWDGSPLRTEGEEYHPRTMVKFCREHPVIATGNTDGDVNIYRLYGYEGKFCLFNTKIRPL